MSLFRFPLAHQDQHIDEMEHNYADLLKEFDEQTKEIARLKAAVEDTKTLKDTIAGLEDIVGKQAHELQEQV